MKISIITVCYNSEKTIADTLESVLSQTYSNYEYLIIDGQSKDSTLSIIKEYEPKFKGKLKWISEKDKGLYDAMNKGIQQATGDVIGLINSDDVLAHENVLKIVAEHIQKYDGVYSNLLMLDEELIKPYRLFKSEKVRKRFGWHPPHPTLYLKKGIYQKYGYFDTQYRVAADFDFMLRIMNHRANLKYVDDYFVYMRSGGTSTNGIKGYYKNFKESYIVLKKNNIKLPLFTSCIRIVKTFYQRVSILNKREIKKATHLSKKKKLVQINTVCNTSTGKIMADIQVEANQNGYQTLSIYGRRKGYQNLNCVKVGGIFSFIYHIFLTTFFDRHGYGSYWKTKKMVKILREEKPDIIHLHNIHGYYLNYPVLFQYLKNEYTGKIFWTFHDCWPFTGHCPYFTEVDCNKWKTHCNHCPNKTKYPFSILMDRSFKNYQKKKEMFTGLKNLTIITPSDWLNKLVKQSFLKEYPVVTIHNGINLEIYKKTVDQSILEKYNISNDKKILLGVANIWEPRKGLLDFIELSNIIPHDFQIVLVGLTPKQIKKLPSNIIGITRTENQSDLVKLYSISKFFINPTYEDNYPTVNLESLACQTKVITYNTGGCVEQITKENGYIIKKCSSRKKNVENILKCILENDKKEIHTNINLDKKIMAKEIIKLYKGA